MGECCCRFRRLDQITEDIANAEAELMELGAEQERSTAEETEKVKPDGWPLGRFFCRLGGGGYTLQNQEEGTSTCL